MTEQQETEPTEDQEVEGPFDLSTIELSRCDISFLINIRNVQTLDEALDTAATSIGRFGMDSFYVMATDPDTGRAWIINDGQIREADEVLAELDGDGK